MRTSRTEIGAEQRPDRKRPWRMSEEPEHLERDTEMKALNLLKRFAKDEDGAVTVDWVVLTAAIVGLGLIVMTAIRPGVSALATNIGDELSGWEVGVPEIPGS